MNETTDIYVLLTDTGTVLTKIIRSFTRDPLNHASIAFDSELNEVYSFGRINPSNPFIAGFVQENVRSEFFEGARCELYKVKVNQVVYQNIRKQIQHFVQNQDLYRYNLIGMLGVVFNIEWERKNAYFCSQFVSTVFERSGMKLVNKSSLLVTPGDLQHTLALELVYKGRLSSCTELEKIHATASTIRTA